MKSLTYITLLMFVAATAVTSCSDSDVELPPNAAEQTIPSDGVHGESLSLTVTLDAMGGRASDPDDPMWEFENYVDLEKFRVLFFTDEDTFLFESKNRWVRQIESSYNNSRWYLSVPLFTHGNEEDWDWEYIKKALTTPGKPFKIAILANRPDKEWCPDFDSIEGIVAHWFDNTGPQWGPEATGKKTVFDLHHVQYDPIYVTKNYDNSTPKVNRGFYDFIQGKDDQGRVAMGASSSWVDWGYKDDAKDEVTKWRHFKEPTKAYPIPMYGIQKYEPIPKEEWPAGTTFNLTRDENGIKDKPISLLRSVVKLELILPSQPSYVTLWYINVYARCEPMNVWDPTDEIWKDDHKTNQTCEWFNIRKYGVLSKNTDYTTSLKNGVYNQTSGTWQQCVKQYQDRMSWFYGAWVKRWKWNWNGRTIDLPSETEYGAYPQIFNTCIQRNNAVICNYQVNDPRDNYIHYIVYTGERNVNDPSRLDQLSNQGTVAYWKFNLKGTEYCVPLTDYFNDLVYRTPTETRKTTSPITATPATSVSTSHGFEEYFQAVQQQTNTDYLPIPLMRNHVYRFFVGSTAPGKTRSAENSSGLAVEMQDLYTEDITFK